MRKFSETQSPEHEHNHNSYKFKNYIQQRFSQDTHGHENGHMTDGPHSPSSISEEHTMSEVPPQIQANPNPNGLCPKRKTECTSAAEGSEEPLALKRKVAPVEKSSQLPVAGQEGEQDELFMVDKKPKNGLTEFKSEHLSRSAYASYTVPIFACHTQGFYVPLNVDYDTLLPYLNGIDLFGKNYPQMPPLHPINISVNYSPASLLKATINGLSSIGKAKLVEGMVTGC